MTVDGRVQLNIGGDVSGQVAIGNNIMQIQNNGGVVYVVEQSMRAKFEKVSEPVQKRPRPYPPMLDRVNELDVVKASLKSALTVSVYGGDGVGKTTFLSHMAHLPETNGFSDGVAYIYARDLGLDDLLQAIFDIFHTSPVDVIPTVGQLRRHLQSMNAVILLDDLTLEREDAQALLNIMPSCSFILASPEQILWGDGQIIPLRGLPGRESSELFSREVGRVLSEDEAADVQLICGQLKGHPLEIVRTASLVRSEIKTIQEIRDQFTVEQASEVVDAELLNGLDSRQKKVLAVLSAAGGTLVPLAIIASLAKLTNVKGILTGLVESGLAWEQGSRYSVSGTIMGSTGKAWDVAPWREALVKYFAGWVAQQPEDKLVEEVSDLLLQVVRYAGEKNHWPEVIRIGRAVERFLILRKRWQAWLDILNLILKAARSNGDRHTEAWVLHQLGTRAMCLSYVDQARDFLTQALNLRQAIGDKAGLAVTQHNLSGLPGIPSPTVNAGKSEAGGGCRRIITCGAISAVGLGVLIFIGMLIMLLNFPPFNPPPASTRAPTRTDRPTRTITPSYTPTITVTSSFTPTNTPTLTPSYTPTKTPTPSFTPSRTPTKTKPPTVTPDIIGPPAPNLVEPAYDSYYISSSGTIRYEIYCVNDNEDVVLDWYSVSDPSGISNYRVELRHYNSGASEWETVQTWNVVDATEKNINYITDCGETYNWRVRARDGAGNFGSWSVRQYLILKKVAPGPD